MMDSQEMAQKPEELNAQQNSQNEVAQNEVTEQTAEAAQVTETPQNANNSQETDGMEKRLYASKEEVLERVKELAHSEEW